MFLVVLLYAVLASTFWFAKQGVATASPCFFIGFRMTLAGLFLLAFQWWKDHRIFAKINKKDLISFFNASLFYIYFAFVLEFWGLTYVSAIKTTMIYSLTPFITAILAYFLHKQKLTLPKIAGITLGVAGLVPVLVAQSLAEQSAGQLWSISLPECALLTAVVSAAYAWFLIKKLIDKGYPLALINGITMLMGGILSWITSLVIEGIVPPVTDVWGFFFWILALIFAANIVFYNLFGFLMTRYSITFLSFAGFLCPLFATFYEWILTGGNVSWQYFVCLLCVSTGLFIFYKDELRTAKQA